jgi:AsmA protein
VTANLVAGALDFAEALTDGGSGGTAAPATTDVGWSKDRIDASALQAVDADITLQAESINLGLAQLGRSKVAMTLDKGRAVTEIREMQAYDGSVTGTVVLNSRGGLSTRATLAAKSIALGPLLKQMAGYERLLATGDVTVNLLGSGNSLYALMNSLSGDGTIRLGEGELTGLDLVGMLRNLDPSYVGAGAKTIFDGISGTFTVVNGVLDNADLKLSAPLLSASGTGKVGIGAQTLDYRLVPSLLEGQINGGLKIPVLIKGTWANPKIRLDLEALARQQLGDEAAKLKVKAEDIVKNKLKDELGVVVDPDKPIEDTLKQELENRAKKGLLDLLGGGN